MKHLFQTLAKYKLLVAVLALILMIQAYCDLEMPEYVRQIIDEGILSGEGVRMDFLIECGAKMMLLVAVMFIASSFVSFVASRIGAKIGADLRLSVYERVMSFSEAEMNKFQTSSLITRSTNDIQQIQLVITMILRMLLYAPVIGMYGIFKVSTTGTGMGWLIFLAVLMVFGSVALLMSITLPKFKMMQPLIDGLNKVSREILTGIPVIRAFGNERMEEDRFNEANKKLRDNQLFTSRIMGLMQPTMMFLMNVLVAAITWISAGKIGAGEMHVGQMTAFITYSITIVLSFLFMSMMSIMIPRAGMAADRVYEILAEEPTISDPEKPAYGYDDKAPLLEFRNVSFKYPGAEEYALNGINISVRKGETVAIIGSTGCGKTTLIDLIPRFFDATEGSVRLSGVDIRDMKLEELRGKIGFVPQKGTLFSGTIAENIRFGREDATDEEVREAAEIAMAKEFIDQKDDGFDSVISQGGTNVSGGQKQRLQIARAVIKKPDILVFDDSFSALDMKTDAALRKALKEKLKDTTKVVVAQRISTVLTADRIYVMDDGRIIGEGKHEDLMDSCKLYREIAESQLSKAEMGR